MLGRVSARWPLPDAFLPDGFLPDLGCLSFAPEVCPAWVAHGRHGRYGWAEGGACAVSRPPVRELRTRCVCAHLHLAPDPQF